MWELFVNPSGPSLFFFFFCSLAPVRSRGLFPKDEGWGECTLYVLVSVDSGAVRAFSSPFFS